MAIKKSAIFDEEYEKLKKFIGLFYDWYMTRDYGLAEHHPLFILEGLEKISLSKAKTGLKMAISDIVEISSDWDHKRIAEADRRFLEGGMPMLSEVRRNYSKKYLGILKRGKIKTITEYYFIKGIMDGGSIGTEGEEARQMQLMMETYEESYDGSE